MSFSARTLIVAAAAVVLSACTTVSSIDAVANMQTSGSAFTRGLHAGYVELAYKEAGFYDWVDAGFFRDKAEMAGSGQVVLPEDPNDWSISDPDMMAALNSERQRLIGVLDDFGRSEKPDLAALAQVMYDCWVEEAEESSERRGFVAEHQPVELGRCQLDYFAAMEELLAVEVVEVIVEVPVSEFVVYFGWDQSDLSPLAQSFLNDVAAEASVQSPATIAVGGFTDTSGTTAYNMQLSKKRAETVAGYLVGHGVNPENMLVGWFGENDLAVETADNVREPNSRRVEIIFE